MLVQTKLYIKGRKLGEIIGGKNGENVKTSKEQKLRKLGEVWAKVREAGVKSMWNKVQMVQFCMVQCGTVPPVGWHHHRGEAKCPSHCPCVCGTSIGWSDSGTLPWRPATWHNGRGGNIGGKGQVLRGSGKVNRWGNRRKKWEISDKKREIEERKKRDRRWWVKKFILWGKKRDLREIDFWEVSQKGHPHGINVSQTHILLYGSNYCILESTEKYKIKYNENMIW